jgi:hypothetical protein
MLSKSSTHIHKRIFVLLILLVISVYAVKLFKGEYERAQSAQREARMSLTRTRGLSEKLEAVIRPDTKPPQELTRNLAGFVSYIKSRAGPNLITVGSLNSLGGKSSAENNTIEEAAKSVPNLAQVKRIEVVMKGSYKSFDGFKTFLSGSRTMPVAIKSAKIDGTNFVLTFEIYGV